MVQLAGEKGRFICVEKPLIYYRVHEDATTKACIRDNRRFEEEREVFCRFWPEPVADIIMGFYKKAYGEYEKYKLIQDRSYISDFDRFNNGDDDMPLLPFDLNPKEI